MTMNGSVTGWITQLKSGEEAGARRLWERYFPRLVDLARTRLRGWRRLGSDEEDVAISAFASLCRGAREGRFPLLVNRCDLWGLLIKITVRKACDLLAREHRLKRGGGSVEGESALPVQKDSSGLKKGIDQVRGRELRPEMLAQMGELLNRLADPNLRAIATWKMEGHTNQEIASKLNCAIATVERRLRLIRKLFEQG